jgi:photosystem II stability/assembly factor-like uncharacterized protein
VFFKLNYLQGKSLISQFCCILFLILAASSHNVLYSQSYWTKINSPVSTSLRNCVFTDDMNGWAAGDDGIIIHTSNGGSTFEIQNSGITFYINDIFFLNKRLGWVVANEFLFSGTTILTTTNGGTNWTSEIFPDSSKFFRTIYFRDSLNGFMGGFGGAIYKTSDAGNSWIAANIDTSEFSGYPVSRITFSSALKGFACGGYIDIAGVIWRTVDGGFNWFAGNYSPEPFYDFYVKDQNNLISAGGDFEYGVQICNTSDAGANWKYSSLEIFGQAYSIDFRTPGEGWMALGYSRNWAVTYDSGNTWTSIPVADSADLYSVDFTDSLHGWAVGDQGVILKYIPVSSGLGSHNVTLPESAVLEQNFPNPFNPLTRIKYQIKSNGRVNLKVYDISGKEIVSLIDQIQTAGSYDIIFDGGNLPSGIYYYTLEFEDFENFEKSDFKAGHFKNSRKMLLLK